MITAIEDFVDKDDRDAIAGYGAIFYEPSMIKLESGRGFGSESVHSCGLPALEWRFFLFLKNGIGGVEKTALPVTFGISRAQKTPEMGPETTAFHFISQVH
jgi:hypothetical protein